jgi:hypothetical protein
VENKLGGSCVLEIWETEDEKKLSVGDLKNKYIVLARNRFIRNPPVGILNKEKNWSIELSRRVISEWRIKSRTRERILSIQLLDTMIEEAKFIKTVEDTKDTQGIESVSYFENLCRINGPICLSVLTIPKTVVCYDKRYAPLRAGSAKVP